MNNWGIPDWLEREVRKRDKTCVYCGIKMTEQMPPYGPRKAVATWEHIVNDQSIVSRENIARCCAACNSSKGTKKLTEWIQSSYCKKRGINKDTIAEVVKKALKSIRRTSMKTKKIRFEGTGKDINLWHTYVHWAKTNAESCRGALPNIIPAIVDDATRRVSDDLAAALRTVLFASFMLEYRLRRVLDAMGIQLRRNTTFGPLLSAFWLRLADVQRLDGAGQCAPPQEWRRLEPTLKELVELRNGLAHANYARTLAAFGKKRRPGIKGLKYYNAVVDAVRLINQGTGYDTSRPAELRRHFDPLKIRHR